MLKKTIMFWVIVPLLIVLQGCAKGPEKNSVTTQNYDPLESINRPVWHFNYNYVDKPIARPVVHSYVDHVPSGGRKAVDNFLSNLQEPASMVNNILQLKFDLAVKNFARFVFNTTFGMLGSIDVMGRAGEERELADFSDVLGHYGVGDGPYLMIPVMGPSTTRQLAGDIVDQFYFPFAQLSFLQNALRLTADGVNRRSKVVDQEPLVDDSLDSYSFVKNAYFQYRRYRFYDGNLPDQQSEPSEDMDKYLNEIDSQDTK